MKKMVKVTIHWFKPNGHWNVVHENVYKELSRFYEPEYFRITVDEVPSTN